MVDSYIHLSIIFPKAYEYKVSQKFVPLNSCTITFDQNFIFTWNCWKMFISLFSTCIQNFSYWHAHFVLFCFFFFITFSFCSRCCMKWDTACRPTDDPFWAFLSPGAQGPVQPPNNICLVYRQLEKNIFWAFIQKRSSSRPLPQQDFVLLYKFETSWALLGRLMRLSRGFFNQLRGL